MQKVTFIRNAGGFYFKFENKPFRVTRDSIENLKSKLETPFEMQFRGYSRASIGRIINSLINREWHESYITVVKDKMSEQRYCKVIIYNK